MKIIILTSMLAATVAMTGCTTMKEVFGRDNTGTHDVHLSTSNRSPVSSLNGVLVDSARKMTLYTYDKDTMNNSNCNGLCLAAWPAFLAPGPVRSNNGGYSTIQRDDGKYQWVLNGKPLYFYANDTKVGDRDGEGKMGDWHTIATR